MGAKMVFQQHASLAIFTKNIEMLQEKPKSVLCLAVSPWHEPRRFRKQLTELLAEDCFVTYITLPFGRRKPQKDTTSVSGGIRVIEIGGPSIPLRLIFKSKILSYYYFKTIEFKVRRALIPEDQIDTIICFSHEYSKIIKNIPANCRIYVANDDHSAIASDAKERKRITQNEARTIENCDLVITVSEIISRKLVRHGKPTKVIYPGHNCTPKDIESSSQQHKAEKSLCFFGYIDWRIDFQLLRHLLQRNFHLTLIGPVVGTEKHIAELQREFGGSLTVLNPIDDTDAVDFLSKFEVLIMPYKFLSDEQRDAIELPNKLLVYFSSLRPVVSTFMPNLKFTSPGLVYISRDNDDFEMQCIRAAKDDSAAFSQMRSNLATANTWAARKTELLNLINETKYRHNS